MKLIKKIGLLALLLVGVYSLNSCTDDESVVANFSTSITSDEDEAVVMLTNSSENATTYQWTFPGGEPASSTDENPIVTYTENGTYSITLVASNGAESDTLTIEIVIDDIEDDEDTDVEDTTEDCILTTDCNTVTLSGSSGYSVSTTSSGNGEYVTTVTDDAGTVVYEETCSEGGSSSIECGNDVDGETLVADFDTSISIVDNEAVVTITNTSENATTYQWTFPGGEPGTSTEENPIVTYTENGVYTITLIASNGTQVDIETVLITIDGIDDNDDVDEDNDEDNDENSGECTLTTACGIVMLNGSGFSSSSVSNEDGTFTITVTDDTGAVVYEEICYNGYVSIVCGADGGVKSEFNAQVYNQINQAVVQLFNTSVNATSYEWSFPGGDPETSTMVNPMVTYTENGTYTITLVASNGSETNTKTIDIIIDGIINFDNNNNNDDSTCTLTTNCESVTLTGTGGFSSSSVSNEDGTYTITVTDSTGAVVYDEVCEYGGYASIYCSN